MKAKKVILCGVILAILGAVVWYFRQSTPASQTEKMAAKTDKPLRMSADLWVGYGPISLAKEKGFFENEGISVRLNVFTEMGDSIKAFESKTVDIALLTLYEVLLLKERGVDVVVVMLVDYSTGADAIVAKKELSLVDLKGKTIAVEVGTTAHFTLLQGLQAGGLKETDVKLLNLGGTDTPDAFKKGTVDAASSWEPFISKMVNEGNGHVVFSSKEIPGKIVDVLVIHRDVLEKRKDDVAKICRGWFKAMDYLTIQKQESLEIMSKVQGSTPDDYANQLTGVHLADRDDNRKAFGINGEASIMQPFRELMDFMKDHQLLKTNMEPNQMIDGEALKNAL